MTSDVSSNSDENFLRPMLLEWAAHFYGNENDQERLIQQVISRAADNPDCLSKVPIERALFKLMRAIVLENVHRDSK